MKKILKTIFGLLLACFACCAPFLNVNNKQTANAINTSLTADTSAFTSVMQDIKISQDGYIFSTKDFEVKQNADSSVTYFLYVNTTITITHLSSIYDLQITINVLGDSGYSTIKTLNNNEYYSIAFNGSTENIYEVSLYQSYLSGGGKTFKFRLVQTPVNFKVDPFYQWTDTNNKLVIAPSVEDSYKDKITLSGIYGTENSPLYVDFYYNGEFYSVYNINGVFYNTITNNRLQEIELTFNVPGQYEVYLYDKTCYRALTDVTLWQGTEKESSFKALNTEDKSFSSYANYESFAFNIEQSNANLTAENMYILAKDDEGNTIVNNQTVNSSVHIKFYNLDVQVIGKVEVLKYYSSLSGTNIPSVEVLYPDTYSKLIDLSSSTITFSDDSSYAINIYDKSGDPIWSNNFKFTILKDIHNSYGKLSSTDRTYVPRENEVFVISQSEIHETSFSGFHEIIPSTPEEVVELQSSTTTNYVVQLARANSSINGINQNEVVNGSVELTFRGVKSITVQIYKDNVLEETKTVSDNGSITFSDTGNYKIVATDQMGTTLTKSFTIKQTLTPSTIALIVIGSLALLVFVIMIIRTRTRIKVR